MLHRKIAYVDLTSGAVRMEDVPPEWRRKYLGGRGINMYLLHRLVQPGTDPLGPENVLILGAGLMTGLPGFGSGRMHVSGLSPACGNLGDSSVGGQFGPEMKLAGFDHVVITGKANAPVYVDITNDRIEIREARHLWGKDTWETQESLREESGDPGTRVLCIGPAGENKVMLAAIITGHKDAAARTGLGAIMGAKNLKAVAARGTKDITVAHPAELLTYFKEQTDQMMALKWVKALGRMGTPLLLAVANNGGWLLTHNEQDPPLDEDAENLYAESLEKYSLGMSACFGCSVHCRHRHYIPSGPFGQTRDEGPEYGALYTFGANQGNTNLESTMYASHLCNTLGLDTMTTGEMIAFAMELYQRGIITSKETRRPMRWADVDAILATIVDIANRKGFGDILADGARALDRLPEEAKNYLTVIKGIPASGIGGRVVKSFSFAQAVSTLGGHYHRNRSGIDVLGLSADALFKLYGGYVAPSYRSYEGKSLMIWWHELLYSVCDAMGFCRHLTIMNSPNMPGYPEYSRLLSLATDMDVSEDELRVVGERIYTTERQFLVKFGAGDRQHDALPARWFEEAVPGGPAAGEKLDRERFELFLNEYYELHGWDQNGHPTPELLNKLSIQDLA